MLWCQCRGPERIQPIEGSLYRLVESQEQVATMGYVDTLEEQSVLEELLERSKPDYPDSATSELHYLLKTPFRYPPLLWGSRFGRIHEPSLFYAGLCLDATLSESAYYRFLFLFSMHGTAPGPRLNTEHTLFSANYATSRGVRLQRPPFDAHQRQLTDPCDYSIPQQLGSDMRAAGVQAFEYLSARSASKALCVALFTPEPFTDQQPTSMNQWFCELTREAVTFKDTGSNQTYRYPVDQFQVNGRLPLPA